MNVFHMSTARLARRPAGLDELTAGAGDRRCRRLASTALLGIRYCTKQTENIENVIQRCWPCYQTVMSEPAAVELCSPACESPPRRSLAANLRTETLQHDIIRVDQVRPGDTTGPGQTWRHNWTRSDLEIQLDQVRPGDTTGPGQTWRQLD